MDTQNQQPPESGAIRVKGRVKWFDPVKGYGFITSKDVSGDVLIHRSVIQEYGSTTVLSEGANVDVEIVKKLRGLQARKLHSVEFDPTAVEANGASKRPRTREIVIPEAVGPAIEAECKWFSRPKGFGFVNAVALGGITSDKDIFVHMDTMRRCNVRELRQGQRVIVRVAKGENGFLATEIHLVVVAIVPPSEFEH